MGALRHRHAALPAAEADDPGRLRGAVVEAVRRGVGDAGADLDRDVLELEERGAGLEGGPDDIPLRGPYWAHTGPVRAPHHDEK